MYKGTHRLVKIYQGMSKKARVGIVGGVLAVGLAAGVGVSSAAPSPTYADTSVTVSQSFFSPVQHTLSVNATSNVATIPVTPLTVGETPASITPVAPGNTLVFTATPNNALQSPYTFVITSANVPAAISWNSVVSGNTDTLTAVVTGPEVLPTVNATVTAKVTDALGDVATDTVIFAPTASSTFNVTQTKDFIAPVGFPLFVNDNTTGAVNFNVPAPGDTLTNLVNAPVGVTTAGTTLVATNAVPGDYDGLKVSITDGTAVSVENFDIVVKGTKVHVSGPVLSQGHAVKINSHREWVYFTQSGAPSWDYFTIIGPGGINNHHGWVYGNLGLNKAWYSGLLANHGYTVFYEPVTGKGSTTPIEGSHTGYVYFVS